MTIASVNTSPAGASTVAMSASPIRPRRRALANLARCSPSGPVPENERAHAGTVGAAVATHGPNASPWMMSARVRGTALCAWSTVSCMVSSFRFGGEMRSRPRRAHSRLGGAAVVTGSGEVARKLHGLSGRRQITPPSTDKSMPLSGIRQGPRGDTPEDQLLVQFQGIFAEYEKAQLAERYRRGKAHRARTGSVNVLSGAPFGYRYVRKTDLCGAAYEVIEGEAVLVAEMFRRYADDGAAIADLARWLTDQGVATRTGKHRWDRSVIWAMLRNPAYAGTAVFGKTMVVQESPGLNRVARLQGRSVPRAVKTVDRPREEWLEIPVPAIVDQDTFARVRQRLADNKRFAARNTKVPSLLQGLAACSACGYGYYRTSARTTSRKIYYYRCLGSDDYRYEGGRVCGNKPVRADYLDTVVWDHITGLLADPALIRAEISKRLEQARTSDPVTRQRQQLELALAKAATSVTAMIQAYSEQLITIDELRARMPDLRAREASLRGQLDALDAQAADRDAY